MTDAERRPTVQENWEASAQLLAHVGPDRLLKRSAELHPDWGNYEHLMMLAEVQFSALWVQSGRITYELTHSLAALFSLTSSPNLDRLPHPAFAIKVPREFLPCEGTGGPSADSWIAVGERSGTAAILTIADSDTMPLTVSYCAIPETGTTLEKMPNSPQQGSQWEAHARIGALGRRLATNTIAYVTARHDQPGRVEVKQARREPEQTTFVVRPPRDVVIDRDFREAARAAAKATNLIGTRRALAHFVRGHWRNQAVGTNWTDRSLRWIQPHRRGDESLGSVIARAERLLGVEP